ncbi:MAG: excinuclease ABC subunit UvrC [Alphaproteobacteria bacterium]|jgi:excinuclease ABC subunit C|nr:excinuclease ABC subunit UvrC [Alphaproteobacteria bacterium]
MEKESLKSAHLRKGRTGFDRGCEVLRTHLKVMPQTSGVYRMLSQDGTVLYVGKAKNLKKRVTSYTQIARLPVRLQRMVAQTRDMEIVTTHTESEALLLEANLIQRFMPPFNVLLRDDKSFPYILLTRDHDFPQIVKHRGAKKRKGEYFGPFASGASVTETLMLLQKLFKIRNCSDSYFAARKRPCLQYHIKRCTAPCCGHVSQSDYEEQVQELLSFLKGQAHDVQKRLADEMQKASNAMAFERAAELRDRIKLLTSIQAKQDINVQGMGDADIIALHREGSHSAIQIFFFRADRNYGTRTYFPSHDKDIPTAEILASFIGQFYRDKEPPPLVLLSDLPDQPELFASALSEQAGRKVRLVVPKLDKKRRVVEHALSNAKEALGRRLSNAREQKHLLSRVANLFGLDGDIKRIEVYDNSHTSGSYAIGAMIAAGPDGFLKKTYRKFNIRQANAQDDFAMMEEVLTRRFSRLVSEDPERTSGLWPDLVLIDGGVGQRNKVQKVMEALGIEGVSLVGIAKGPDRNAGRERYFVEGRDPFTLEHGDPVHFYLQRLRDEAHRYAIGTHRARREKALTYSGLEEIPGIGPKRKKALLQHFGSAKALAGARIEDLARTEGVSPQLAKKIYDFFHSKV